MNLKILFLWECNGRGEVESACCMSARCFVGPALINRPVGLRRAGDGLQRGLMLARIALYFNISAIRLSVIPS